MSFKSKIKRKGNELISQYSSNPYYVNKVEKKRIPLWAKISLPSSLIVVGAIAAIVITNSLGSKYDMSTRQINNPNKIYNSAHNELDPSYIKSVKEFANDFFLASQKVNYDGRESANRNDEQGNIIFSPLSLTNELYMLYDAANDIGKAEIKNALHYEGFDHLQEIKKMMLNTSINKNGENRGCYSDITNAMFVNSSYAQSFNQAYINMLTNYYYADLFQVDFNDNDSRKTTAKYMNEKTGGMFDISATPVDPNHGCIDGECVDDITRDDSSFKLFNSTYLETNWAIETFKPRNSFLFTNNDGSQTEIKESVSFPQYECYVMESEGYYILQLPLMYYSFNILYPKEYTSYSDVLTNNINNLIDFTFESKQRVYLDLRMPFLEIIKTQDLDTIFKGHLGINTIYNDSDCLTNIFNDKAIKNNVGSLQHTSGVKIDKNGITASSFTNNDEIEETTEEIIDYLELVIDHPFLFSITNSDTLPLYIGQIYKL